MRKIGIFAAAATLLAIGGCTSDEPNEKVTPYRNLEMNAETRAAATANNSFALNLFRQTDAGGNMTISTYGVFSVLSMLANGDTGECRDEILDMFGFGEGTDGIATLNGYCSLMNRELPGLDGRVKVSLANAIWSERELDENFSSVLHDTFEAEWFKEDGGDENGMRSINKWVSENTHGMIPHFLKEPTDNPIAIVNAIYFKGKWDKPFKKADTAQGRFRNIDGDEATAQFMNAHGCYRAYFDSKINAVELKYGSGNYSMLLIKPAEGCSFEQMADEFDSETFDAMLESTDFTTYDFRVSVPKFKAETDIDMLASLRKVGFRSILKTEFNSLLANGDGLKLNMLKQATAIEVNEDGTEAASATMAGMDLSPGFPPHDPVTFDSPFIYIIRETSTNTILFIGRTVRF